jgi:bifunctional N-acetylglucosamine-1-phosphate-uridyltransferase/glucosamine-1-phosphate-acetyltransferase GlmU-like protein
MNYQTLAQALDDIRAYGDDYANIDILAKIVEGIEAAADELAAEEPTATITIATWRQAASALADIANDMPDENAEPEE